MFARTPPPFLLFLLLLLPACSGAGGGSAEVPALLEDSFDYWQFHWLASDEYESTVPTYEIEDGELLLVSDEPAEGRFAQVTLLHTGYYEAAQALIIANSHGPDDYSAFKFVFECSLGTTKHRAVWRIGQGYATEFHVEGMDGTVLPGTVLGAAAAAAGEAHTYRITARLDDEAIDAFRDGVLVGSVELPGLRLSPTARIYFRSDEQYSVSIDDFVAWDRDRLSLLELGNVQQNHQVPGHVSFLFSARWSDGGALVVPEAELGETVALTVLEDGADLGGAESENLLHPAADLPLDLVLVLDYSESMDAAGSGTGIATMLEGVQSILDGLAEAHRVAILEFHDNTPGDDFSTRIGFTTDKDAAWGAIQGFSPYHGFSTCWDAVAAGLSLFPETPDPGVVRGLAFLSDGYDGASSSAPAELIDEATARGVRLYGIGVHPVTPLGEQQLEDLSAETGGIYQPALEVAEVSAGLERILEDLLASYQVSYVSATAATFQVGVALDYDADGDQELDNYTLDPIVAEVDGASIQGDARRGILTFTPLSVVGERVEFFIRARYLPRDVTELRFELPTDTLPIGPGDISVERAGGPLEDWDPVSFAAGWYSTTGPELTFGDSGFLFRVILEGVDSSFTLPISFDNSIYANDTLLYGGDAGELLGNYWETTIEITLD